MRESLPGLLAGVLLVLVLLLICSLVLVTQSEAQAPPPADIYQLFNYSEPGKPGVIFATWYQVNPEPGVYNWSIFERALDTIKAPAHIFVSAARSDVWQDSDGV